MSSVDHEEVQPPASENSSSTIQILAQSPLQPQHESTETQNTQNDNTYRSPLMTTSKSAHSSTNSSVNQDDRELSKIASNEKKSASDSSSSKSGLVSPSSCSVSSNENTIPQSSSNQEIIIQSADKIAVTQPNVTSAMGGKVSISTTVRGKEGVQQEHIIKPEVVRSINPIASLHKKVQGRQRSNSVPSSLISNRTHTSSRAQPSTTSKTSNLRRGKWTAEEEAYVARVIQDFNNGHLNAPAGTTLRTYLSDKLNCDPMRITKKFTGEACIGKRVFHPAVRSPNNADIIDTAQRELEVLEQRWRRRLDMQKKEAQKKIAATTEASHAAQAAAVASAPHLHDPTSALIRLNASALPGNRVVVTKTASWLDRANAILSNRRNASEYQSKLSSKDADVKKEMKELEGLIEEGPIIQKASGLLLQKFSDASDDAPSKRKVSDDHDTKGLASQAKEKNPKEKAPVVATTGPTASKSRSESPVGSGEEKRFRKSFSANNLENLEMDAAQIRADFNVSTGDAEDVSSFLGFISSVQKQSTNASPKKN